MVSACQCVGCSVDLTCFEAWGDFCTSNRREALYVLTVGHGRSRVTTTCVHPKPIMRWHYTWESEQNTLTTLCFCKGTHDTGRLSFNAIGHDATVLQCSNEGRTRFGMVLYPHTAFQSPQYPCVPRLFDTCFMRLLVGGKYQQMKRLLPSLLVPKSEHRKLFVGCVNDLLSTSTCDIATCVNLREMSE
jgi:hypothetical protein